MALHTNSLINNVTNSRVPLTKILKLVSEQTGGICIHTEYLKMDYDTDMYSVSDAEFYIVNSFAESDNIIDMIGEFVVNEPDQPEDIDDFYNLFIKYFSNDRQEVIINDFSIWIEKDDNTSYIVTLSGPEHRDQYMKSVCRYIWSQC